MPGLLAHKGEIGADCWKILNEMRWRGWEAPSVVLGHNLGMLNYRARISDLRLKHGLPIEVDRRTDEATKKEHNIYFVPSSATARAEHLWRFRSLDGFVEPMKDLPAQLTFF